jgi:hypothetical protein
MDEEVARLRGLGATVVERFDDITVMHDPEGNNSLRVLGPATRIRQGCVVCGVVD